MFSRDTLHEITGIIENYTEAELNRMFIYFDLSLIGTKSKPNRANDFLIYLRANGKKTESNGESLHINVLQYVLNTYYKNKPIVYKRSNLFSDTGSKPEIELDPFNKKYKTLLNSLNRDGYNIKNKKIEKKLPDNLELSLQKDELTTLLNRFKFDISKEHLNQAIKNHTSGNWASANAQFRTFLESILMDICKILLPDNDVKDASKAIRLLSQTVCPPFFLEEMNEIETRDNKYPYVLGLWKRLHPEGSHKGLSSEEDCTFRYHTCLIFVGYLMKQLDRRKNK